MAVVRIETRMQSDSPYEPPSQRPSPRNGIRGWFIATTVAVFVAGLFKSHMYPGMRGLYVSKLWELYLLELWLGFPSFRTKTLGSPDPGTPFLFLAHLGISLFLGLVVAMIVRWARRTRHDAKP